MYVGFSDDSCCLSRSQRLGDRCMGRRARGTTPPQSAVGNVRAEVRVMRLLVISSSRRGAWRGVALHICTTVTCAYVMMQIKGRGAVRAACMTKRSAEARKAWADPREQHVSDGRR